MRDEFDMKLNGMEYTMVLSEAFWDRHTQGNGTAEKDIA